MSNVRFASNLLLSLIVFLAGVSGLILELVWSRYLHLILGVSAYAVATVLACFMIGLAVGNWHGGRLADRARSLPTLLFSILTMLSVWLLLSPFLYRVVIRIDTPLLQAALALFALLLPSYLIGAVFPSLVKYAALNRADNPATPIGWLAGINTLGGALGVFVAGFLLIPWMGLLGTLHLAAGASFVAGCLALQLPQVAAPTLQPPRRAKSVEVPRKLRSVTLIVFILSGFTSLAYQVYWTRILTWFFRDTIYDLTIVLAAFLCGLVLGNLLASRVGQNPIRSATWLGLVELGIGFSSLAGLIVVSQLPYAINHLQTNTAVAQKYGGHYWLAGNAIRFGYAFLLMLVPTTFFGMTLPLAGSVFAQGESLGKKLGVLLGSNTIASALGPILAVLLVIPLMGTRNGLLLNIALNVVAGLILLTVVQGWRWWATGIFALLLALMAEVLIPPWDRLRMSTSFLEPNQPLEAVLKLDFYREDATGLTSVVEFLPLNRKYLVTNRLWTQNTSESSGLDDHRRLGQIPVLLHGSAKKTLVVGLGAGLTLRGAVEQSRSPVDCVELSPGIVEAANQFTERNNNVLKNPLAKVIVDDARHYMSRAPTRYDVIVLDIFFPMSSSSSSVFSQEYFQLCKKRLAPGGLVCQWLPIHQLSMEQIKTIVATFQSVFPHTSLWFGTISDSVPVVGCVGSDAPLELETIRARHASEPDLRDTILHTAPLLLSHFIMADEQVRRFHQGSPIDTDNRPIIEFQTPKLAIQARRQGVQNLIELGILLPPTDERYVAGKRAIIEGMRSILSGNDDARIDFYQAALRKDPENEDLIWVLNELTKP